MIELTVTDILSKASDDRAYVMMLKERNGERRILVAIGHSEAQGIAFALKGIETKRPVTHDLFKSFALSLGVTMKCATIDKVNDGTFYSHLIFKSGDTLHDIDARTSDAVAIALRMGAPIYIEEPLLDKVAIREAFSGAFSIPISVADIDTLRNVMDRAVKDENYELAMKIKEEIDSRTAETAESLPDNVEE